MSRIYITATGFIVDDNSVGQMIQALNGLVTEKKPDEIYILISSPGGSVNSGIVLYNFIRSIPTKVITHNIGQVDSIGNVIFLAGEERYMAPATSFLFHGVIMNGNGPFNLSKSQLDELLSQFQQDETRIEQIVCDRTDITKTKLRGFYDRGESLNSDDALKFGIVNKVIVPSIPDDAESFIFSLHVPSN